MKDEIVSRCSFNNFSFFPNCTLFLLNSVSFIDVIKMKSYSRCLFNNFAFFSEFQRWRAWALIPRALVVTGLKLQLENGLKSELQSARGVLRRRRAASTVQSTYTSSRKIRLSNAHALPKTESAFKRQDRYKRISSRRIKASLCVLVTGEPNDSFFAASNPILEQEEFEIYFFFNYGRRNQARCVWRAGVVGECAKMLDVSRRVSKNERHRCLCVVRFFVRLFSARVIVSLRRVVGGKF